MIGQGNRLLGAVLLVSGTTIGAGMLALPITTGLAGFFPSLIIMTFIWLYMMLTAFYLLEVNLRLKGESNLISMMRHTLGRPGEIVAWITYLLLLYSLTAAYLVGCSQIIENVLSPFLPAPLAVWVWPLMVFVLFALFVYFGTEAVDLLNRFFMVGLALMYLVFISFGYPQLELPLLAHLDWKYLLPSVSVVLTTFGYHVIIPTLTTYLDHNPKHLKQAIFIGSAIPFVIYVCWQLLVMGVVPAYGEYSLTEAAHKGMQVTFFLSILLANPWVGLAVRAFAFCAIVTSLLGVSLSLSDFLADGLKVPRTHLGRAGVILLTFLPPLFFALFFPRGFQTALEYAGIFVVILLALLPTLMAWSERAGGRDLIDSEFRVPGGKILMTLSVGIALLLLGIEVFI